MKDDRYEAFEKVIRAKIPLIEAATLLNNLSDKGEKEERAIKLINEACDAIESAIDATGIAWSK